MFEDDFYTIDDAAKWLTKRRDREVSSKDIYRRVKSGELPICFMFDGLLSGVTIHNPRKSDTQSPIGLIEWVNPDVPFGGTVKSLVFRGDENTLEATLVSIIALDYVQQLRGHDLPVTKHPYKIKPGYEVHGMLNYLEVPRCDWLFSIDDLHKLVGNATPPADSNSGISATGKAETMLVTSEAVTDTPPAQAAQPDEIDHEEKLAALFDPVPVESLAKTFPTNIVDSESVVQWKKWTEAASRNGLAGARDGRARFNPYKAGLWFVNKGFAGWNAAKLHRVLSTTGNLPARSTENKHLLTDNLY